MPADKESRDLLISEGVPLLLRDLIHSRAGIYFEAERLDMMLDKVVPLAVANQCYSLLEYYYLLKYEENGVKDWNKLIDALSVQETYFWREMGQIRALVDVLVPAWFAAKKGPLNIWSAACATGEEPLTIAIALAEKGWGNHPITIEATDASCSALEKAKAGVFREKSFRALPSELRRRYFTPLKDTWQIDPNILRKVSFHRANLLASEEISPFARSPFVFCRNVFIYFSPHGIRLAVATIASRMPANGHLFVGASESLLRMTADFELREIADAYAYVRI